MSVITHNDKTYAVNEKLNTRSLVLLFILSAVIIIFIIFYLPEIKKDIILFGKINPFWLAAAVLAQCMTYFFTAFIYRFLLGGYPLKQLPGLWELIKGSVISLFFNQTMPSAGISGNTFFFNFLARFNMAVTNIVSLILAELLIFYAAMEVIILALLAACLVAYKVHRVFMITLASGVAVYLVFGTLIALAGRKKFLIHLFGKVRKIRFIKKIFKKVIQRIEQQGISKKDVHLSALLKNNKLILFKAFLFQIIVFTTDGFTLYALFYGLAIPVSPFFVLLSLICTKIISILPFLPGALILYESSMSFFFVSLGVPLGVAVIVILLYRFLSFWVPMPIGVLLYRRWLKNAPVVSITQ